MGREIRKVPSNWEHPKKGDGKHQPMRDIYYGDALDEWMNEHRQWLDGTSPSLVDNPEYKEEYPFYALYGGNPPDVEYYQIRKYTEDELTHIQLYENTSEGTPLSPLFHKDDFEKLCEWAADNATTFADYKASKEKWMNMLGEGVVSHQEGGIVFM